MAVKIWTGVSRNPCFVTPVSTLIRCSRRVSFWTRRSWARNTELASPQTLSAGKPTTTIDTCLKHNNNNSCYNSVVPTQYKVYTEILRPRESLESSTFYRLVVQWTSWLWTRLLLSVIFFALLFHKRLKFTLEDYILNVYLDYTK